MKDMLRLHMVDTNYLDDGDLLETIIAESCRGERMHVLAIIIEKSKLVSSEQIRDTKTESDELIAILTTIVKKVKPRDT